MSATPPPSNSLREHLLYELSGRLRASLKIVTTLACPKDCKLTATRTRLSSDRRRGLVNRRLAFASFFADGQLLSQAGGFVGTGSWTSRVLLLAITGGRSGVPPFVLLDGPLGNRLWGGRGKDCSRKTCT